MNKRYSVFTISCFILFCTSFFQSASADLQVQSLSLGTPDTSSNSSISYSYTELQNYGNSDDKNSSEITINNNYYYPAYPYYYTYPYSYYPTYVIRPYYSRGISIGGYNYKGFAYNYGSNSQKKAATTKINMQTNINPKTNISRPQQNTNKTQEKGS